MAQALKDLYTEAYPVEVARQVSEAWPAFDREAFLRDALDGFTALELTPRGRHLARALRAHLPPDIPAALKVLTDSLGPPLPPDENLGAGMAPFLYMPHVYFVATYAADFPGEALDFQEAVTQRFTAEFSIRTFLEKWPDLTWARMARWVRHESAHVRRLVSEGTRPLLPWAARVAALTERPERALALLEQLRDDPSSMVRRSVANHLNDVSRAHPGLVLATCQRWWTEGSEERRALVRHALRTLVKRGDRQALALLGASTGARLAVEDASVKPARLRKGQAVEIRFTVHNPSRTPASTVVDLRVHFVRPGKAPSVKVFRVTRAELAGGARLAVQRTLKVVDLSTRTHHPGRHVVEAQLNGEVVPVGAFTLLG